MNHDYNPEAQIREVLSKFTGDDDPSQAAVDAVHAYAIEQNDKAEELFRCAVDDGVNFATTDESGDIFVNTKWLGMIVRSTTTALILAGTEAENQTAVTQSEILNQTIMAARKFVEHNEPA